MILTGHLFRNQSEHKRMNFFTISYVKIIIIHDNENQNLLSYIPFIFICVTSLLFQRLPTNDLMKQKKVFCFSHFLLFSHHLATDSPCNIHHTWSIIICNIHHHQSGTRLGERIPWQLSDRQI